MWLRLVRLLHWRRSEREIADELRFHIEMEAEDHVRRGLGVAEARRRALIAFGGEDRWRERVRATRGTAWFEDTLRDLRLAGRGLARTPVFAAAAIGTIALSVGAATATYSVVDQVVLSPLPYGEPGELVSVWSRSPAQGIEDGMTSWPNFVDWRDATTTLEGIAAISLRQLTLMSHGDPAQVVSASVSRGFFELLGVPVALGRAFRDDEVEGPFAHVVVLSHELYTSRFGADPGVIGRTILLDGDSFEVVGVAASGRAYPRNAQLWRPLAFGTGRQWTGPRERLWLTAIARLADGVNLPGAQQEMDRIAARLASEYPDVNQGVGIALKPLRETVLGHARAPMLVLLGAVALVMLIAIVNVANLLLARGTVRARELAARVALGAGRGRVAREVLSESLLLGGVGGVLGAALSYLGVDLLVASAPTDLPRLDEVGVDLSILGSALTVALCASLAFGLVPALRASRIDPGASLRSAARGASHDNLGRLRGVFVGGQFALAFVLLVGSGLLVRSFLHVRSVDPGFEPRGVLSVSLALPPGRYSDADVRQAFQREMLDGLEALPDVESAGTVSSLFLSDVPLVGTLTIESRPDQFEPGTEIPVIVDAVSPGFFSTVGMEIVAGRGPLETDTRDDPPVVVVNETFARLYLDGLEPIGERFTWGRPYGENTYWFTIVGIVEDARRSGLDGPVRPAVFESATQRPWSDFEVLVRTTGDPLSLEPAVREAIGAIDDGLPLSGVRTLEQAISDSLAQRRFVTWILGVFSLAALSLAGIGVFGVMAYVVGRRTREIGIRVALGAARRNVVAEVLGEGLLQAGTGLLVGGALSMITARFMQSQLFEIGPSDPMTLIGASATLLLVASLACLIPARRASDVDPMVALRDD